MTYLAICILKVLVLPVKKHAFLSIERFFLHGVTRLQLAKENKKIKLGYLQTDIAPMSIQSLARIRVLMRLVSLEDEADVRRTVLFRLEG
jgi:hypothetical protein